MIRAFDYQLRVVILVADVNIRKHLLSVRM